MSFSWRDKSPGFLVDGWDDVRGCHREVSYIISSFPFLEG